ncbi:hypothetical protein [Scytonema sp. PRP1]|uniref:hypothetical protein n=1 Tax=Scytonema sp. PRP1 TaxID=3120513 RepID=UPI002FD59421
MNSGVSVKKLSLFFFSTDKSGGCATIIHPRLRTGVHSDSWLLTPEFFFGNFCSASRAWLSGQRLVTRWKPASRENQTAYFLSHFSYFFHFFVGYSRGLGTGDWGLGEKSFCV